MLSSQPARATVGFSVCIGGVPGLGKTALLNAHVTSSEPRDALADRSAWSLGQLEALRAACPGRLLVAHGFTRRNTATGGREPAFSEADCNFYDALVLIDGSLTQVLEGLELDPWALSPSERDRMQSDLLYERVEAQRLAVYLGVHLLTVSHSDLGRRLRGLGSFLNHLAPLC